MAGDFSIGGKRNTHLADVTDALAQACSSSGLGESGTAASNRSGVARLKAAMRAHMRLIWRILRRSGLEPRDADEATQDVFLIFSRKIEDVAPKAQRSFLVQTALRVASDRRRAQRRFPEVELDPEVNSPTRAPDEIVGLQRARALLDEALNSLSDEQRTTFILIEMEQMTMPEVSATIGIPIGTVASRLRSARQQFDGAIRRLHVRERAR